MLICSFEKLGNRLILKKSLGHIPEAFVSPLTESPVKADSNRREEPSQVRVAFGCWPETGDPSAMSVPDSCRAFLCRPGFCYNNENICRSFAAWRPEKSRSNVCLPCCCPAVEGVPGREL